MSFPAELWPWGALNDLRDTFLPSLLQAEGIIAVFIAGLIMLVLGRAVLGARALPEIALIAGWGLVSLVLTLWGVKTPLSLRIPAAALIAVAAVTAFSPRGRLTKADAVAIARLLIVALPLLAVLAAAFPSQPDSFTNQIPNAAYLYDYGQFPAANRHPMLAVWPAFPYNLQLAAFMPALLLPAFPPGILTDTNLLLQLAFALLLARSMRGAQAPIATPPSWAAIGGALLLTAFLNPGFDPKIQFSGYGDPAITVAVAIAAWQAERLLAALAAEKSGADERLALTFLFLAGAAIKQVSIVLMAAIAVTAFLIGAFDRRIGPRRAFAGLVPAFAPAILLVGIWRFYVMTHFAPDDELRLLPFSAWSFASIPAILSNMAFRVGQRLHFFILLYGVALAAIPLVMRRGMTPAVRLFLLTLGVTLIYTAFLIFTYIAHFPGEIGASAHSFFRYNTHLEFLATLAAVAYARESWVRRGAPDLGWGWRAVGVAALVLALAVPVAAAGWIRHDRRQPQPLVWGLAHSVAPYLHDGDRVALLLPGDNRSVAFMLRVAIALDRPHSGLASFDDAAGADIDILNRVMQAGDRYAVISCVPSALAVSPLGKTLKLPTGQAALLSNDGKDWRLIAAYPYPKNLPPTARWTTELSPGPFCR
jgi:hypothetical protein